jgi:phosphoribosylformylglycinamidine (FGAM) synthase-like enzyme
LNLEGELALQQFIVGAARDGMLRSAHDCAEGGLAITLAECTFGTGGIGLDVDVAPVPLIDDGTEGPARGSRAWVGEGWSLTAALYSESASRAVVSVSRQHLPALLERARAAGVPAREIGTTGGGRIRVSVGGRPVIDVAVQEAQAIWDSALEARFTERAA